MPRANGGQKPSEPSARSCRSRTPATGTAMNTAKFSSPAAAAVRRPRALCSPYRSWIAGG
ncbi:hypothetical protein B7755_039055 [Streptomyces sp. NBS 14/10]|uniref:hypothetical protein n=1 Tax=Streptomyces sp. NBS 14/10 TaxID=1945643 RepID=UPI0015C5F269|nr:hypothetical protein [Streptomyces sp. NBS 14/10]KAK1183602.1 hypothetical protein B7755_039055 [Streptomyces sp. NBS 14/10]NUP37492.1 hypothetical protein [Streptomyces sp.]NUS84575.1 hypothetical protein [Streptomyces sp.]